MDFNRKLNTRYYVPKTACIPGYKCSSSKEYLEQPYFKEKQRLLQEFKKDALHAAGLDPADPMTERAYTLAWRLGHDYGHSAIYNYLWDIAYVIKGDE
jgi:hypothetical protein